MSTVTSSQSLQGQNMAFSLQRASEMVSVTDLYQTIGFISSGTYGNVFKAKRNNKLYAIKKFKPEKEGELALSSGISQSACREIGLCRELDHENVVKLTQVIMDASDRSIAMVFEYAEHDLLVILTHVSKFYIITVSKNVKRYLNIQSSHLHGNY